MRLLNGEKNILPTISEKLGAYAATLKYKDLPAKVIHQAKRTIIDTLGCAFGGYASEPSRIAQGLAATVRGDQKATILFSGRTTSVDLAAFTNDIMVRYLDYNDGYISGKGSGHPSDSIAALLAATEMARAGGRDLILATVICYEIFCRLSDAWDNKPIGIDHVTTGGVASVAGVARLLGLTQQQINHAISLTVAMNIALNQTRRGTVSYWKGCAYGNANRNAIFAAQLAARGMTGPSQVYEGREGFFNVVSRRSFELAPFGGGGRPFRIMRTHFKYFPLGNYSQTVVTAALEARAAVGNIDDIAEVHVRTAQRALQVMAGDPEKWRTRTRETADHSMPYNTALALMYGVIDQSYFDEKYFLHDKKLLDLVRRVKCSVSEEANRRVSEFNLCELDVVLRSGERKSFRVEYHRGHWRNPMSDAEVEKKFRSLASGMMPDAKVDALLEELWKLEDLPEVGRLMRMTRVKSARKPVARKKTGRGTRKAPTRWRR